LEKPAAATALRAVFEIGSRLKQVAEKGLRHHHFERRPVPDGAERSEESAFTRATEWNADFWGGTSAPAHWM